MIDQFLRDWSIFFPRISPSSWFITSSRLIACGWQVMINKWVILVSLKIHLKRLWKWVLRLLMTERGSSNWVRTHGMNFTRTLASLPLSLYNSALSNAWNLYSSNSSIWYFLSKAITLATIFSSFIAHNGLCSRFTYKWQDLQLNSRQGEVSIDTCLEGSWKGPKSLIELDWLIHQRLIDRLSNN